MEHSLDTLHARARGLFPLQRLAILTRLLLALAFVPTALIKVQGLPFTVMGTDTAVGYFFDAMHRTGGYWRFIGWSQLLAGALLLIPATSLIGALIFLPIIANIFTITVALHFKGTPFVTGPMLLGVIFLLCWDYHRLKQILFWPGRPQPPLPATVPVNRLELAGYVIGTAAGLLVLAATRSLVPKSVVLPSLVAGAVAGVLVLIAWTGMLRSGAQPVRVPQ